MTSLRLFFALWPPEHLRLRLWRSLEPLRESVHGVRWVPPERYHITLRFLGDIPSRSVADLASAARSLERESPFRATLGDVGTFPRRGSVRVYWVAVRSPAFQRLRELLDAALLTHGFPAGKRRFRPHLTLGRARRPGSTPPPRREGARLACPDADSLSFGVRAIDLVRSELFPTGPRYANIHRVVLSGNGVIAE